MGSRVKIAVPSNHPGGLDAERSGHFGRCDIFTVVELEGEKIVSVSKINNVEHIEGGCHAAVDILADNGVNSIVVRSMGARPLMGFREAGINVIIGVGNTVGDAVNGYIEGGLPMMTEDLTCKGH